MALGVMVDMAVVDVVVVVVLTGGDNIVRSSQVSFHYRLSLPHKRNEIGSL